MTVTEPVERWVYRWIITILIGISCGAGTNYITRLDRLVVVEVELREINKKVDSLIDWNHKQLAKQVP